MSITRTDPLTATLPGLPERTVVETHRVESEDLPENIGKFRILRRLGEGATSEVFLAHDAFHDRNVAIKRVRLPPGSTAAERRFSSRFFDTEAALVGQLSHPNVVQLLDAIDDGDASYLVMEYVPGTTLREYCSPDRLLSLEQIVEIGFKCAMALSYVYRRGLIHRDVKPANVLAVTNGKDVVDVKLSDFGSALVMSSDRTQVHRVGSLAYMSPEQLNGDALDCRADIYSLGAVLYHLIAGRPPFDAQVHAALLNQICNVDPPPLVGLRDGVSSALDITIRRALAKSAEERPANWDEFAGQLSSLVANNEVPRGQLQHVLDSERFNQLRNLEFFTHFGDVELWEVVHRARWQRLPLGTKLFRKGQEGRSFFIIGQGEVEVYRDGQRVAVLGAGTSVGEMAYLAPSKELRRHSTDIVVSQPALTISFNPDSMAQLSPETRHRFDAAFIHVLVRRLHTAHEQLAHPRRIL